MERRSFLKKAAVGTAATATISVPALAADLPTIKWRCASSFPKSLDTIYGGADVVASRVRKLTDGKFDIRVFAAGEIVPGLQVLDAVSNNTVECGHTASYYFVGKNKAFAFDGAVPFGMTARQQNAWWYKGGGQKLTRELFAEYNIVNFNAGNTGAQMGGWFRKEIKSLADLKGLKMRIGGFAGEVLSRLGVVPQQIAGGDIYPALEKGTIDAAEWIGPYDDEKLGFYKVAPNYYYPGFWEGGLNLSLYVNSKEWEKLPQYYKDVIDVACQEATLDMLAEYDNNNPQALARLIKNGVKLHAFPRDILDEAYKAAFEVYEEEAAKNPSWARIYEPWKRYRNDQFQWFKLNELFYENYTFNKK
ncbi:TRAP transporter substrate-binding protein [Ampullimonas aquatilis]|uniref:TRAP transporter substrate-binding protein n=1 Tax=Ampullimonas aquatilis TaxID=1341549 RepID=UPI003C757812